MIFLCVTDKHQELIEAPNAVTAAAFMRSEHPGDLDVRPYEASDGEVEWMRRNGKHIIRHNSVGA